MSTNGSGEAPASPPANDERVRLLLERGAVTPRQVAECEEELRIAERAIPLVDLLLEKGYVDAADLRGLGLEAGASDMGPGRDEEKRVGPFRLIRELGRGGMGVVYEAIDTRLQRRVAVKLLTGLAMLDDERIARFRREAKVAARLNHPAIVEVHEVGEEGDAAFIVMDLVEGRTLRARIEDGPMGPREAGEVMRTVALALEHAHSQGVVHRDMKPENILLDAQGRPYVSDFGLAVDLSAQTRLTLSGTILGTPAYMAPEQARGAYQEVGVPADVYGAGAVLYNLLTGCAPFDGGSVQEVLRRVVEKAPKRPGVLNPRVPRDLEVICLKCLEKDPRRRYASAAELAADLDRYLAGEAILARPAGSAYRVWRMLARRKSMAVMACVALMAVAIAVSGKLSAREMERRLGEERHAREALDRADPILLELETWGRRAGQESTGDAAFQGKAQEAEALLGAAVDPLSGRPEVLLARARLDVLCDRPGAALGRLGRLRDAGEEPPLAHYVRGWALLKQLLRGWEELVLRRVHASGDGASDLALAGGTKETAARAELSRKAWTELDAFFRSGTLDARTWRSRLALPFLAGEYDQAMDLYRSLVDADDEVEHDPEARWLLARAIVCSALLRGAGPEQAELLEKAREQFLWLERWRGGRADYWSWRGLADHAAGRHEDATRDLDRAVAIDPRHWPAVYGRAFAWG